MTVITMVQKKSAPRSPRGAVLLKPGQTWVAVHNGNKVTTLDYMAMPNKLGRVVPHVWYRDKGKRQALVKVATERRFRSMFMELGVYVLFSNQVRAKLLSDPNYQNAAAWVRGLFNVDTGEKGLRVVPSTPFPKQPVPKVAELWRHHRNGYVLEVTGKSNNGGELWIRFSAVTGTEVGSMAYTLWKKMYIRIGPVAANDEGDKGAR